MSGRRLAKNHVIKAVSVNSLQDCQEACIAEGGFVCRAISYRFVALSLLQSKQKMHSHVCLYI